MKNNIKIERARHNLTQGELAERIGVSRQSIHAIEKGKFVPSALLAIKISRLFGLTVEELFFLEDGE